MHARMLSYSTFASIMNHVQLVNYSIRSMGQLIPLYTTMHRLHNHKHHCATSGLIAYPWTPPIIIPSIAPPGVVSCRPCERRANAYVGERRRLVYHPSSLDTMALQCALDDSETLRDAPNSISTTDRPCLSSMEVPVSSIRLHSRFYINGGAYSDIWKATLKRDGVDVPVSLHEVYSPQYISNLSLFFRSGCSQGPTSQWQDTSGLGQSTPDQMVYFHRCLLIIISRISSMR